jgi:hypothetical protein
MARYPLQPVADQRVRDERAQREQLADAIDDVKNAERALARFSAVVTKLREAISHTTKKLPASADELARVDRYAGRLRHMLELAVIDELRAQDRVEGRQSTADLAKEKLTLARAARRAAEEHFVRWRDEQRKLAERRAD